MSVNNKVCCVCGNKYHYCINGCSDSINKPTWMGSFCCENCRNVYNACSFYNINKISKEEAMDILNKCDLSNKNKFTATTKKIISKIYENNEVVEKVNETETKGNDYKKTESKTYVSKKKLTNNITKNDR